MPMLVVSGTAIVVNTGYSFFLKMFKIWRSTAPASKSSVQQNSHLGEHWTELRIQFSKALNFELNFWSSSQKFSLNFGSGLNIGITTRYVFFFSSFLKILLMIAYK